MAIQQTYREMEDIVASQDLAKEQKMAVISAYFEKEPYWPGVLHRLDKVDKSRTQEIALELFRKHNTSRIHKLQLGRYLLRTQTSKLDQSHGDPPSFTSEYRQFLIDAIVNGGIKEFFVPNTGTPTAVGEYASIAGGINAPVGILFSDVADQEVIPVLVKCLSAPDHVYPREQGDLIRGKPGEPTGRNTQRQGIPFALMYLEATEAIPALQEIVKEHHDRYLRDNATMALNVLTPLEKKKESTANKSMQATSDGAPDG
jgi:hypothetical protein